MKFGKTLVIVVGLIFVAASAQAAIYSSTADADSATRQSGGGDDNAGDSTQMDFGATNGDIAYYNCMLKWDLPSDIAGATINSATVTLQIRNMGTTGGADGDYGLQAYTQAWTEMGVTSLTYDGVNAWPGGYAGGFNDRVNVAGVNTNFDVQNITAVDFTGGVAQTVVFDAKTLIEYWAAGNANDGLAFQPIGSQTTYVNAFTHEDVNGGSVLTIDYTPVPEPATMGLLAIGTIVGLIRRRK